MLRFVISLVVLSLAQNALAQEAELAVLPSVVAKDATSQFPSLFFVSPNLIITLSSFCLLICPHGNRLFTSFTFTSSSSLFILQLATAYMKAFGYVYWVFAIL